MVGLLGMVGLLTVTHNEYIQNVPLPLYHDLNGLFSLANQVAMLGTIQFDYLVW